MYDLLVYKEDIYNCFFFSDSNISLLILHLSPDNITKHNSYLNIQNILGKCCFVLVL
jgi:hypothetical protein